MDDRNHVINEQWIKEQLVERGVLGSNRAYMIEPEFGGLNSRVFVARCEGDDPILTIRVRDRQDRSAAEVDGLSDAFGCPGVPNLRLLTNDLLVLDYLPGKPCGFERLGGAQIQELALSLSCVHETIYKTFTIWPERTMRPGTREDLLRFRVSSLRNFENYDNARNGLLHPALPELIGMLSDPDVSDPSWQESEFSRLHGDLSYGNLIWHDQELALIDWEYSRVGDPAEDLAYLLVEQGVGTEQASEFERAYLNAEGDADAWDRVPVYALFTAVDSCLWWADYAADNGVDAGQEIATRVATAQTWLAVVRP